MDNTSNLMINYRLDAPQSTFTVQAFAGGFLSGFGHNPIIAIKDFEGEGQFMPQTLANASLILVIKAGSLELVDEVKESDKAEIDRRMRQDVLEITRFPKIVFQSSSITVSKISEGRFKARIIGDLTMHGVTRKNMWILAQITFGNKVFHAKGDFTIKQTDFDIKLVRVAAGALKVKDELQFNFDLVGYRV